MIKLLPQRMPGIMAAAVAGPIILALMNAPESWAQAPESSPAFEVASIKVNHGGDRRIALMLPPGRLTATNVPLKFLIQFAYKIKDTQLSGGPGWIDSERYDVEAKIDEADADGQNADPEERTKRIQLMLRSLLADRFKLTLTHETKELPVYALVVAKGGPKFHESEAEPPAPPASSNSGAMGQKGQRMVRMGRGEINMSGAPIAMLADTLSNQVGRTVLDQTGLKGNYDIELKWTPNAGTGMMMPHGAGDGGDGKAPPPPDASGPSIFTALQEQLGLKLESQKGPVETYVIAHVEKPSEN